MLQRYKRTIASIIAVMMLLPLATPAFAQAGFLIDIQPEVGPPGTTVVITGRDAQPNAEIRVLYAPFSDLAQCRAARDASLVAEIRADSEGRFVATHLAAQINPQHAGNTYLATLNEGPVPRPTSDLECFSFQAAPEEGRFFPETGQRVSGRFLEYWEQNGGLYVFGYPLTGAIEEDGRTVQYFERARFELFPENQPPYDVQLGRLGVEVLEQRGIDWRTQPVAPGPVAGCLYFDITRHNVCNQQIGIGFLNTWRSNGLTFAGQPGVTYAESLALFGYPITEPYLYTTGDGRTLQVQWFERARLEWHPDNPAEFRVLLGRLGADVLAHRGQ